jgi:hypothetical protein
MLINTWELLRPHHINLLYDEFFLRLKRLKRVSFFSDAVIYLRDGWQEKVLM